jgi:hypothetical protein
MVTIRPVGCGNGPVGSGGGGGTGIECPPLSLWQIEELDILLQFRLRRKRLRT